MTLELERCIACGGVLLDDDMVYNDESGGTIHARCCGPERESYCNPETGDPLKDDEPIPPSYRYGDALFGEDRS
jgi:hypothetical protein